MEPLNPADLARLQALPGWPADYLAWLAAHGWGEWGDARFMLYAAPVPLAELHPAAPAGLWAVGDDFAGVCACFAMQGDGCVIEWDSATRTATPTGERFAAYLAAYLA